MRTARTITGRMARATGRFLWSFFVDDTPEVPIVVLIIVGAAFALHRFESLAVVALPLLTVGGLGYCVWRACRSASRHRPARRDAATSPPRS